MGETQQGTMDAGSAKQFFELKRKYVLEVLDEVIEMAARAGETSELELFEELRRMTDELRGLEAEPAGPRAAERIRPLREEERMVLERALRLTGWNVQEAARRLGIGRATIYRKIERYGLTRGT